MLNEGYEKNGLVLALGGGLDAMKRPASGATPYLALDTAGGNHGAVTGATLTENDTALLIDAANEGVNCGNLNIASMYGESGKATFNFAFKYVSEARERNPLSKYGSNGFIVSFGTTGMSITFVTSSGNSLQSNLVTYSSAGITENGVYYISLVYDNTLATANRIKIYVNGVLRSGDATMTGTYTGMPVNNANFWIGNLSIALTTRYYNSSIKQVSIYQDALSAANVVTLYVDYLAGNSPSITTNLLAYYPLNQANCRSSYILDTAGNAAVASTNVGITTDHNGRAGRGFDFIAASSSKIVMPNTVLRNRQKFTIMAGFYYTGSDNTGIVNMHSSSDLGFIFTYIPTRLALYLRTSGNVSVLSGSWSGSAGWKFICATFDGTKANDSDKVKLYGDAVLLPQSVSGTLPSTTVNADIELSTGVFQTANQTQKEDLLLIYNDVKPLTIIQKNYNYWRSH